MRRLLLLIVLLLAPLLACSELTCGDGTHEENGKCVPNIPLKCGDGTVHEQGWCNVEDTHDGSEDSDVAEDRDGDGSSV